MDVSTRWWYGHLTVEPKTQGCVYTLVESTPHSGTENTGCVYTLVVWTPHSGTENTGMCLHVGGIDTSQWNRKHRDVSTRRWYEHLTAEVEQKTQGGASTLLVWTSHSGTENTGMCLHVDGMNISVEQKTQGCVYTLVV